MVGLVVNGGVFLVVETAVVPDEVEVGLEVVDRVVSVLLQFLLDGAQVHRVFHDERVVDQSQRLEVNRKLEVK